MKTTITAKERLELLGLLVLGIGYHERLDEVEKNICTILNDKDKDNLITDSIWEHNRDIDQLLGLMGIEVSE